MKQIKNDQRGLVNSLTIPLIISLVAFVGVLGFGIWAFVSRNDYKENVDQKIATAVDVAKKETASQKDNEFIEREKQPLKEYNGPSSSGSISLKYPKTWSAYVDETKDDSPVDGYFHPNFVPGVDSESSFAFRLQVTNRSYAEEIKNFDSAVKNGEAKAKPYKPVNVSSIIGSRIEGEIENNKAGIIIILPLRDKTIKLWTESDQFVSDFENNILKNFKFSP